MLAISQLLGLRTPIGEREMRRIATWILAAIQASFAVVLLLIFTVVTLGQEFVFQEGEEGVSL
jgi:hypothetical protein